MEQVIERLAPDRVRTYNDTGTEDGTGAAKTTEIHLKLGPGVIDDAAAARFAATVNEPLTAMVEPRHLAASGAIGHFHHAGDPRFAAADGDLDDYFRLITTDPVEPSRLYGMMRYGNAVCVHSSAVGWVYLLYRDRAPEKALRSVGPYQNEANDQIMAVWCHAARTGNREHLLLAQRYSRAVADTGFVHADPRRPERVGLMHYHNGHVWSGGMSPSHSLVSGLLTDYYLTGNRRLLEVAREVADRIVRTQEPAGILSCRGSGLHREYAGPLSVLLELYQATWEQRYGALAERSLAWLLRTVTVPGRFPNTLATGGEQGDEALVRAPCLPEVAWGNKYYLFEPALRLFPSPALREFVLAEADYWGVAESARPAQLRLLHGVLRLRPQRPGGVRRLRTQPDRYPVPRLRREHARRRADGLRRDALQRLRAAPDAHRRQRHGARSGGVCGRRAALAGAARRAAGPAGRRAPRQWRRHQPRPARRYPGSSSAAPGPGRLHSGHNTVNATRRC